MGWLVIMVDESAQMGTVPKTDSGKRLGEGGSGRPLSALVATAINSWIARLPNINIALVGYRTDDDGNVEANVRWGGNLAGRRFVAAAELQAAPLETEKRTRTLPGVDPETIDFSVWYRGNAFGKQPQVGAWKWLQEFVQEECTDGSDIIVVNIHTGSTDDGNPLKVIQEFTRSEVGQRTTIIQCHMAMHDAVPATLYPSGPAHLTGQARDLFQRSSPLSATIVDSLRNHDVPALDDACGLVFNAKLIDLSQLLNSVAEAIQSSAPIARVQPTGRESTVSEQAAVRPASDDTVTSTVVEAEDTSSPQPETAATDDLPALTPDLPGLLLFVFDRSVTDPFDADRCKVFHDLSTSFASLVNFVSQFETGAVDVAVVSYGTDSLGDVEVRTQLDGPLAGHDWVRNEQILASGVRVEEETEEVSDGAGGILQIRHRRPILVELEPANAATPMRAFEAATQLIARWREEYAGPVFVVHLTRGEHDDAELQTAVKLLGGNTLYHVIATESPHAAVICPGTPGDLQTPGLQAIFNASSPLVGRSDLADDIPSLSPEARGVVVNGSGQLLLHALKNAVADVD